MLFDSLAAFVTDRVLPGVDAIPADRQTELRKVALFLRTKLSANEAARAVFICTHNSRRSHLAQLWAKVAASYYGHEAIETFSGGTEATAFNPRAVAALERAGFQIENPGGENPRYKVSYGPEAPVQEAFSKVYSETPNPKENFAAVMTCSQADKNCPTVFGATLRVALPYVDPKEADDTPAEASRYDERSLQIAQEMFFLMKNVRG